MSVDPLRVPSLAVVGRATNSEVKYKVQKSDYKTKLVITGYEVFRFGVPMIGEYDNEGIVATWKTVTIRPAVPGAQYRITAWTLGNGTRSATPAVEHATTGEASEYDIRILILTGVGRLKSSTICLYQMLCLIYM